jgi:hypothetical protein
MTMHEWLLFRLAALLLMFGILVAVALVAEIRRRHRQSPERHASPALSRPVVWRTGASLTGIKG